MEMQVIRIISNVTDLCIRSDLVRVLHICFLCMCVLAEMIKDLETVYNTQCV